jgi:transcriptional regulator with GAF, ATPase, and Fis domain
MYKEEVPNTSTGPMRPALRAIDRGIWGLVAIFAIAQAATWWSDPPQTAAAVAWTGCAWIVVAALAIVATRRIGGLSSRVSAQQDEHRASVDEIEQLEVRNAMLQILARSVDVPLAFHALAQRIVRLVPCDRVGLALVSETGEEFQTYTARVREDERRTRPRPEVVFRLDRTVIGRVVRSREAMRVDDIKDSAQDYLDANVLHTAGFKSALLVPLVSKGRAVGTLNVVSRQTAAFTDAHAEVLLPIAEILAVAHVAQQLQVALAKFRTMEMMADATLSIAAEINSALQTIVGHCDLLEREHPDPALQRDLAVVVHQAQRITGLLEKMRTSAHTQLKEVAESVELSAIPSSPEKYGEAEHPPHPM